MSKENFFGDMSFGEALKTSLKQAIEYTQDKKSLRTIKSYIPNKILDGLIRMDGEK